MLLMVIDFIIQLFMIMGGGSIHSDVLGVFFPELVGSANLRWYCCCAGIFCVGFSVTDYSLL